MDVSADGHSGASALHMKITELSTSLVTPTAYTETPIAVNPGIRYRFSAWARVSERGGGVGMQIYWFAGKTQMPYDPAHSAHANLSNPRIGDWAYFEGTGVPPQGATGAVLLVTDYGAIDNAGKQTAPGGDVWWDDLYFGVDQVPPTPVTAPDPSAQQCAFQNEIWFLSTRLGTVMGQPVQCEHVDASSGDRVQQTTTGLAVVRKSSGRPVFTDGSTNWALSDSGDVITWTGSSLDPPAELTSDVTGAPRPRLAATRSET